MGLSNDLISKFVKITNDKTDSKESTVYGTVVEQSGQKYVQIDGSDLLTPVTTTADIEDGERVTIMIKNHSATVTGNITTPSASSKVVGKVVEDVDTLGSKITEVEILIADRVTTKELDAEVARIDILNSQVADINTLINGNLTSDNISSLNLTSANTTIENAMIKDAMIDTIAASKLTAGTINTSNITIQSSDGTMILQGSLLQFKDENDVVRIQLGKDTSGNFSFVLYDETGEGVLINENGIQDSDAIADGLIVDAKVADDANIAGSKLDIASVVTEVNNGTTTIKSNKIYLDDESQTLDVAFNQMQTSVEENADGIKTNSTALSVQNGQISTLITENELRQEEISELSENLSSSSTEISNKYSALEQELDGFRTTVGETYATKETVNDLSTNLSTNYSTTTAMNSAIEQKANEITSTVSETYATKETVNDLSTNLSTNYSTTTAMNSAIEQKANEITSTVSETYATKEAVNDLSTNLSTNYSTTTAMNSAIEQKANEITSTVSETYATKETVNDLSTNLSTNYSTTTAMNSAIEQKANEITSTVSETYATKTEFNNLEIGGTNLYPNSNFKVKSDITYAEFTPSDLNVNISNIVDGGNVAAKYEGNVIQLCYSPSDTSTLYDCYVTLSPTISLDPNTTYTLSFDFISAGSIIYNSSYIYLYDEDLLNSNRIITSLYTGYSNNKVRERKSVTFTTNDSKIYFRLRFGMVIQGSAAWVAFDGVKLEKGNKATDWSPAPEDVQDQIDETNDNLSTNYSTTTAMNSAIEQKANEITSTVSETYTTKTEFNNLEIGGTNLVTGTKDFSGWSYNPTYNIYASAANSVELDGTFAHIYTTYDPDTAADDYCDIIKGSAVFVEPNTEYTLSFWARGHGKFYTYLFGLSDGTCSYTYNSSGYTSTGTDGNNIITLNSNDTLERYWVVFKTTSTASGYAHLIVHRAIRSLSYVSSVILGVKFEKGNKATDWTPAPEDVQDQIDETNDNLSSLTTRVSTAETKLTKDSLTTTIGSYYTTSADVDSQIVAKGYATTSEVSQTASTLTAKFSSVNGQNLIRNSTGLGGTNLWYSYNATIRYSTGGKASVTGNTNFLYLENTDKSTSEVYAWSPRFELKANTTYTLSGWFYINPEAATSMDIFVLTSTSIAASSSNQTSYTNIHSLFAGITSSGWIYYSQTFTTAADTISGVVRIDNNGYVDGGTYPNVHWASLMLNEGSVALPWSPHPSECYDGITTIDKNGVKVTQSNYSGYTQMSASGFYVNDGNENVISCTSSGLSVKGTITVTGGSISGSTVIDGGGITSGTINGTAIKAATITADQIAGGTITSAEIAANTITASKIASGTITSTQIASGTITASNIKTGTITATQIASGTITSTEIAANTITGSDIASGTITASNIAAGTITASCLSSDAIKVGAIQQADSQTKAYIKLFDNCSLDASSGALRLQYNASNYIYIDGGYLQYYSLSGGESPTWWWYGGTATQTMCTQSNTFTVNSNGMTISNGGYHSDGTSYLDYIQCTGSATIKYVYATNVEASSYVYCNYLDDYSGSGITMKASLNGNSTNLGYSGSKFYQLSASYVWGDSGSVSDEKFKENIRYVGQNRKGRKSVLANDENDIKKQNKKSRDYDKEDLIIDNDFYDFVKDELDICEYNYIQEEGEKVEENFVDKIGLIANDYADSKIGSKVVGYTSEGFYAVNTNNLLFVTLGALQYEINKRDSEIESLKARLSALEKGDK